MYGEYLGVVPFLFFFFSSRRRHTRCSRDWSSDVCSSDLILRTTSDLRDVIAKNPFAARRGIDPRKLVITFLPVDPGPEARDKVLKMKPDPEEVRFDGRELYIYFPDGMGRSKLVPALGKALKNAGTARNWNTVTKLLEIAERLEAPAG